MALPDAISVTCCGGMECAYTWKPIPRMKPIRKLGFFQSTVVENMPIVKIHRSLVARGQKMAHVLVLRVLGDRATVESITNFIHAIWTVHSDFRIEQFMDAFKITFKSRFDSESIKRIDCAWIDKLVLIVIPWVPNMEPSEDLYDTLPDWVTFANLKPSLPKG